MQAGEQGLLAALAGRKRRRRAKRARDKPGRMRLRVSVFLYLMALILFALGFFQEFISYFVAIVLHEMAHAEVARRLGYTLTEFKLTPYGAALIGQFESGVYGDEIKIALAGPMCNLFLCIVFVAALWLIPGSYFFTYAFVQTNLYLALFNLIPIFPLDGGRILLAALSSKFSREEAYKRVRIAGYVLSAVLMGLCIASFFFAFNLSFFVMSVFILLSTVIPDKASKYQQVYRLAYRSEKARRALRVRTYVVSAESNAALLFKRLNANYFTVFIAVDAGFRQVARFDETALERVSAIERGQKIGALLPNLSKK